MTADLAAWLLACLDKDELAANDAARRRGPEWGVEEQAPWRWGDDDQVPSVLAQGKPIADSDSDYGGLFVVEHIARWDPAAVLADCAAKRAIMHEHRIGFDPCDAHDARFESVPCTTLRLLALPFAARPGYRDEWKP